MDGLEVPQPLAGRRIEREQRVGEQIGACAVGAVEVRCAERSDIDGAARCIDRHAGQELAPPAVLNASGGQVSYPNSPGQESYGSPTDFAGAGVVRADMTGAEPVSSPTGTPIRTSLYATPGDVETRYVPLKS